MDSVNVYKIFSFSFIAWYFLISASITFPLIIFRLSDSPESKKDIDVRKKKHKKHKKSSKKNKADKVPSKKHKKQKKKHKGSAGSSDSEQERPTITVTTPPLNPVNLIVEEKEEITQQQVLVQKPLKPIKSMNEKFSELMGLDKKNENGSTKPHKLSQKLKISTDPEELVQQITKSIANKQQPMVQTLEILSTESESDV